MLFIYFSETLVLSTSEIYEAVVVLERIYIKVFLYTLLLTNPQLIYRPN